MTTQELAELFLTGLNDLAEAAPHPNFLFNMNEFVAALGISDLAELASAVQYLESRGFIYLSSFDAMGGVSAGISVDGQLFVEKGGETGIIDEYKKNPRTFFQGNGSVGPTPLLQEPPIIKDMGPEWMHQQSQIQEKPRAPEPPSYPASARRRIDPAVDGLLLAVSILIEKDTNLTKDGREDLLKDVESLKIQVRRTDLNKDVVIPLLDSLATVDSLVPLLKHVAEAL
jgi:hypothetical protein